MPLSFRTVAEVAGCQRDVVPTTINRFVINSKHAGENDCFFAFKGKTFDGNDFVEEVLSKKGFAVMTDKIKAKKFENSDRVIYVEDPVKCLVSLAKINRNRLKATFVTVTGACGKTTTKEYLGRILSTQFKVFVTPENQNNLLGVSLALCNVSDKDEFAIIETGTNRPGEVRELTELVKPHGSVTTNIHPSHLQFFNNVSGVLEAETEQQEWLESIGGFWCLNHDDAQLRLFAKSLKNIKLFFFGGKKKHANGVFIQNIKLVENDGLPAYEVKLDISRRPITLRAFGSYNALNLAAATAVVFAVGIPDIETLISQAELVQPAYRSNMRWIGDNLFIIDCYNANPGSFKAAIEETAKVRSCLYPQKKLVGVFADMLELGSKARFYHYALARWIKKANFSEVYYLGAFSDIFRKHVPQVIKVCDSLHQLKEQLELLSGSVVLVKGSHYFRLEQLFETDL